MEHERAAMAPRSWAAPTASRPLRARLSLPGSKSITNRALVLASLAEGPGTVINPLRARDTDLMTRALTQLGASIAGEADDPARWHVSPGRPATDTEIDVGNAGTVMRFVPPVAALTSVRVRFHGDPRASQRPVGPLIRALSELGAVVEDDGRGAVPFTVRGSGAVPGGAITLDASASSQLISALLLAAPHFDKGVEVRHEGTRVPSAPHIAMTVAMLREAGVVVETARRSVPGGRRSEAGGGSRVPGGSFDQPIDTWRVMPGPIAARALTVEPDLSNAVPFFAAALVTGGSVTVPQWPQRSLQPVSTLLDLLTRMGAACTAEQGFLTVRGGGTIRGISADLGEVSEFTPVLAALAALADSPSHLTGIAHMRRHETDRLAALASQINALGGDVTERPGSLEIRPRPLVGGPFVTYDDHRMVMCAAVLGLAVPGITVLGAGTVGKTFPGFTQMWSAMAEGPS
jgi:3-phosphoshikimate 1-carboxyvinyltransferase